MKKYFALGFIVLVIGAAFTPYIKAVNLSDPDSIEMNSDITSSVSEESDMGLDLAILDIVPYFWYPDNPYFGVLRISLEIKNVGETPCSGWVRYYGNASYRINNKVYSRAWGGRWGEFGPGESWFPESGHGLRFKNFFPRIFYIEFEIFPMDSNPENNHLRQVYLVRGGGLLPFCKRIPLLE